MNREEIENRIEICKRRTNAYNEVGNIKIVDKYEHEKYEREKLLSDLVLLNKKKINELLEYKKGYYKQKEVIDKIFSRITLLKMEDITIEAFKVLDDLLDILKEVSE